MKIRLSQLRRLIREAVEEELAKAEVDEVDDMGEGDDDMEESWSSSYSSSKGGRLGDYDDEAEYTKSTGYGPPEGETREDMFKRWKETEENRRDTGWN